MYKLLYAGGEGRKILVPVDFMLVTKDGNEILYVESAWDLDHDEDEEQFIVFWDCLAQLAEQAENKNISLEDISGLDFWQFGNPRKHFNNLQEVPNSLQPYLSKYFR